MKSLILLLCLSFAVLNASEHYTVKGYVFNSETGEVIAGASIAVIGKNKGTYSSPSGAFKLPLKNGSYKLKVSSIGFRSKTISVSSIDKEIKIFLKPDPVNMQEVSVVGEISADVIMQRAIKRKTENMNALKNFKGELYSKFVIEMDNGALTSVSRDEKGRMAVSSTIDEKNPKETRNDAQMFILESLSDNYIDYEKEMTKSIIKHRRQTANIKPQENVMALSGFKYFYQNQIELANVVFESPLSSDDAFDIYDYELKNREMLDDKYVYVIRIIPATTVYPAFRGTAKVLEGSFDVLELDLAISKYTSFKFVKNLKIYQKFAEIRDRVWHPVYSNITGNVDLEVITSLLEIKANLKATSIYNDYEVNTDIPDSIFRGKTKKILVAETADTASLDFWESNSLREVTKKEKIIYKRMDSLYSRDSSSSYIEQKSIFDYNMQPYFNFNRVGDVSLGIKADQNFGIFSAGGFGAFSFGLQKPLGELKLNYDLEAGDMKYRLYTSAFSKLDYIADDRNIEPFLATVFSLVYHDDYYDYFRKDGYSAGLKLNYGSLKADFKAEQTNHMSLQNNTDRSIILEEPWRKNPQIRDGNYFVTEGDISLGDVPQFILGSEFKYETSVRGGTGVEWNSGQNFSFVEGDIRLRIPTFETGYVPMMLNMILKGGYSVERTPIQYQFRMPTKLSIYGGFGSFYTADIGKFGGTEYQAAHFMFNTSDLWWRALGLPRYEGRGIDLTFSVSTTRYISSNTQSYLPTGDYYTEAGFGFSRIPTFLSNVIYLSFESRWGIGPLAKDKFGWGFSASVSF